MPAATNTPDKLLQRVVKAGFPHAFLREAVLPEWWDASCDKDPELLNDLELRLAKFLAQPLATIRTPGALSLPHHHAQLRKTSNLHRDRLAAPIHASLRVAGAVLRSLKVPIVEPALPPSAAAWRNLLLSTSSSIELPTLLNDLWSRGIPVVHVDLPKLLAFQGIAALVDGRPVIVLGTNVGAPSRQAFYVAHEAAHLVHGDCAAGAVVDEADENADASEMEREADSFARRVLQGDTPPLKTAFSSAKELALAAERSAQQHQADPGGLIWSWAARNENFSLAQQAMVALYLHLGAGRALRRAFDAHVDIESANETDRALLRCVAGDPARDSTAD